MRSGDLQIDRVKSSPQTPCPTPLYIFVLSTSPLFHNLCCLSQLPIPLLLLPHNIKPSLLPAFYLFTLSSDVFLPNLPRHT